MPATATKKINLYYQALTDGQIVDDDGRVYRLREAREIVDSGRLGECNIAFRRLFHEYNLQQPSQIYGN